MSPITSHVLDLGLGRPAEGIEIRLEKRTADDAWEAMGQSTTNADGRAENLVAEGQLTPGRYRLTFATAAYFEQQGVEHFYPQVTVEFHVAATDRHYHVPLLLSPFGYSTYRGS